MPQELISKKLEQITDLLDQLSGALQEPWSSFGEDWTKVGSAERNFQLIVDIASDINTQIILEKGQPTPDTSRQSFKQLERLGILPPALASKLASGAGLRNVLVHEYDFDEDPKRFYDAAKGLIEPYQEYCRIISQLQL